MFVGKNAASTGEGKKYQHKNFGYELESFLLDVFIEIKCGKKENSSHHHNMGRREARLARTVGASIQNPDFIENKISDYHEGERNRHQKKAFVDFFDGFSRNPLVKAEASENRKHDE